MSRKPTIKKKPKREKRIPSVVVGKDSGEINISVHHAMPKPPTTFYADELIIKKVRNGVKIVVCQTDAFCETRVTDVIQLVFDTQAYKIFLSSLMKIKETLERTDLENDLMVDNDKLDFSHVSTIKSYKVFAAYVSASVNEICLDFYNFTALEMYKAMNKYSFKDLEPVIRVEMLPGRINHLL